MSTKTKKTPTPGQIVTDTRKTSTTSKQAIIPTLFLILYILVELIPETGATDVMAPQWLYLTFLDLACAIYFLLNPITYTQASLKISGTILTLMFICIFILSGISIFAAINKIESLVCFARLTASIFMYFNIAILLYDRLGLFKTLTLIMTGLLLLQSLGTIGGFIKGYGAMDLNQLILGLKGNAGNKNILAASLVIKLPFVFYGLFSLSRSKWFYIITISLGALAIAILNARAAYLGLFCIILLTCLFIIVQYKKPGIKKVLSLTTAITLPIVLAFVLSAILLSSAASLQEKESYFGNLGVRLGSITTNSKGSGHRLPLWNNAIDFIKKHPVMGAGYGNWKLASVPYERILSKDFEVTYHVHNDFLEAGTELGILGILFLLGLFVVATYYAYKTMKITNENETIAISAFSWMALAVYFIDAFFNFPAERPVMQLFLALSLAVILNNYLQIRVVTHIKKNWNFNPKVISFISIFVLFPALWLTFITYKSMIAQYEINADVQLEKPQKTYEEVNNALPAIPNLNSFCMPVAIIKANYLYREKNYEQALSMVKEGQKANPYLPYDDLLLSKIYSEIGKPDSALYFANAGFHKRPKSAALYQQLNATSFRAKDTATLNQAFATFTQYRSESWAWNEYLNYLYDLPHDTSRMRKLVDSALQLFPGDSYLQHKKSFLEKGK